MDSKVIFRRLAAGLGPIFSSALDFEWRVWSLIKVNLEVLKKKSTGEMIYVILYAQFKLDLREVHCFLDDRNLHLSWHKR